MPKPALSLPSQGPRAGCPRLSAVWHCLPVGRTLAVGAARHRMRWRRGCAGALLHACAGGVAAQPQRQRKKKPVELLPHEPKHALREVESPACPAAGLV